MAPIKYSDIRRGYDSADGRSSFQEEASNTFKFYGASLMIAGAVSFGISRMEYFEILQNPIVTLFALVLVFAQGYLGHKVTLESARVFGKLFLFMHSILWGVASAPAHSIHPSIDLGTAYMVSGTVFMGMSLVGEIRKDEIFGSISLAIIAVVGVLASALFNLMVMQQGVVELSISLVVLGLLSALFYSETESLKISFREMRENNVPSDKIGIIGAMHILNAIPGMFFGLVRGLK